MVIHYIATLLLIVAVKLSGKLVKILFDEVMTES